MRAGDPALPLFEATVPVDASAPLWKVAVDSNVPMALTYRIPPDLRTDARIKRGQPVLVPIGQRHVPGVLLNETTEVGEFEIRHVFAIAEDKPALPDSFLQWCEWLAKYYVHPIGCVVEMAYPPLERKEKLRKSKKSPVVPQFQSVTPPELTEEQARVIKDVESHSGFNVHLVHGVTGSGKTEVYMRLLADVVEQGKQGIVLVPEISLTPQLVDRFAKRFGDKIAVIHSHLTAREKTTQWWAMLEGKKQILIGARSALFCPLDKLGMIIIDEEHESSFKQDDKLKYHARDAAIMLAKFSNCPIVLGSATPALETWHNAKSGRYKLHQLKSRVADRALPDIEVIDLREERDKRKTTVESELPFWITQPLYEAMRDTLEKGQQTALFLNRRGVAPAVVCGACGWVPACPNCAVKLTLHGKSSLLCHYCDYHETMTEKCTHCPDGEPKPIGIGTELIERDVAKLFPKARIARMDRDEIGTREDLERMIKEVEDREVDVLVGTQMIAKGLDFPGLTLVGIVVADIAFNLPDFRASERAFQLITQVSGRSGRHLDEGAGRVIIQTYNPDHPSIKFAVEHDYEGFASFDLMFREHLGYPPFGRLASFRIQGLDQDKVKAAAKTLRNRASTLKSRLPVYKPIEILGPAPSPLAKLRNHYRWQLLVKHPDPNILGAFCRQLCESDDWLPPAVKVNCDVDAVHLL